MGRTSDNNFGMAGVQGSPGPCKGILSPCDNNFEAVLDILHFVFSGMVKEVLDILVSHCHGHASFCHIEFVGG